MSVDSRAYPAPGLRGGGVYSTGKPGRETGYPTQGWSWGIGSPMSHSLKMLPCKKRRAVAVGPQSPSVDLSYHKECAALLSDAESVKLESSNPSGAEELRDSVSKHWRVSNITDTQPVSAADKTGAQPVCSASTAIILDEDLPFLETTDGGASKGNMIPGKGTSQVCSQRAWKEPVENFLRSGKRITVKSRSDLSQDSGEGQQNTKETASATEFLEQGKDQEFTEEGKSPKLHTGVEVILQRHPHPSDNHSPKQVARVKSSLLLPIKAPATIKTLKNTKTGEQLQQTDEETEDVGLFIPLEEQDLEEGERRKKRRKATKRKREERGQEEEASLACDIKLDDMLDRTLEDGAKQHNLTVVNVRNILHEVITNEHVVAMMKAAISETEDMPMFEPKMTRSKLKEVVEKGVVIPAWNISPIKKANEIKPPQFVDIPLEEDDSSDEEYQPEDEDEDETAEESLLESDVESTASSPRGAKRSRTRQSSDMIETDEEGATLSEVEKVSAPLIRHISAEVVPMGPPPPPKPKQSGDSTFMEKLHAVDEELASSPVCMDSYQSLDDSLIAFRTRSKRPLKDVPLGQLEAELRAPDITPDMYDPNTADDEDWKRWLGGLMNDDVESEDEADDDDDPEYNFLEDLDEPDTEDFRNDRAVRITKKEVNELMEELFETFQDEMGFSNMEDEGPEDEDTVVESRPNFNTPQALRFEEPLANLLNEQHRTVKEQLEQLRIKKSSTKQPQEMERSKPQIEKPLQTLVLDMGQRKRLHQQMQQHVQLLTQIHLLTSSNPSLSSEASTTRMFLTELSNFAHSSMLLRQQFHPKFQTVFQPCNLKGALQLIEDFHAQVKVDWSPRKTVKKSANEFPCLPKQVAWILATRKVFMYPELLPICSLKAKAPQNKIIFTKAEDNLLALGLKHFEGTEFPKPLISKYLLPAKTAHQLTVRIKNLNMNRAPDNIIRYYKRTKQLPILFKCCEEIQPSECKPPVEREEQHLPFWLKETMEKLTWLATERRLSQEGDSEEENSQEENSEPEEEEEEEEGEGEGMESLQKEDEMTDEIAEDAAEEPKSAFIFTKVAPEVETNRMPPDENAKVPGKNRNPHRARNKRGRTRASKDTSKLLLLYDEEILERDPLREQKDLAFAQAYLNRVREALRNVPGKYEDFLRVIYEFETSTHKPTAVDLYSTLQTLLQEWPQLLTDFAAFLLPEQALECGLFEEQQAFDKSRKFLRQLEICFAENPTHHQKIIKVLQSCADCLPQDIAELKTQMWQLLKGHDHLQDEFSIFFDHLRPSASRIGDFEEINWTEEKEYEFDGFEEVSLPDVEEEEETPKMHTASKNKKRKEIGGQNNDKEMEWVDGVKECSCSCHEGSSDPKLKKSKRRTCSHSSCKVCDSKSYKNKDSQELTNSLTQQELSPQLEEKELGTCKEPAEESLEYRDEVENGQSRTKTMSRKADSLSSGSQLEGQLICCRGVSSEGGLPNSRVLELSSTGSPLCSAKAGVTAVVDTVKESQTGITDSGFNIKLPQQNKSNPYGLGSDSETRLNQRRGGTGEGSLGLAKHVLGSDSATRTGCTGADHFPGMRSQQNVALQFKSSVKPGHAPSKSGGREMERLSFPLKGKPEVRRNWLGAVRKLKLKILDKSSHLQVPSDRVLSEADGTGCTGVSPFDQESQSRLKSNKSNCCFEVQQLSEELECRAVPSDKGEREDEQQQKIMEATVCAKNSKVSSTGEKVVLWTREADRVILTTCQERGAHLETFSAISQELGNKTASEVSHRFRELMRLFHTSYDGSSEDEEDATSTSNTDQLSDKDLLLSEEEQDD
ncbi:GON-4-like protein isoform X8 [Chrysemys picta bellii]|uniref:GON-4-like protein isoform X8 n=1 Tax=Chrysemys picta bellii TaxID=8478 RepID=UPI0032B26530